VDLTLVGLGALLVGGLGIAGGVRGYLGGRLNHMAAMKCMGGSSRVLFVSYWRRSCSWVLSGPAPGCWPGASCPGWPAASFPRSAHSGPQRGLCAPLIQAALFRAGHDPGLFHAAPFSRGHGPALGNFQGLRLRGHGARAARRHPAHGLAFALLALMVFWFAGNAKLAAWFVGGTIMAFLLFKGLARVIRWLAGKAPQLPWTSWRIGVANIHRPGSPGVSLVFALGFGLTALVAVVMVNASLTRALSAELAEEAPDFFFMDIRPDQVAEFRALVESTPGVSRLDLRPMIRGRIVRIGDTPVENATVAEDVAWAVRGDRGLSYSGVSRQGSTLVRGEWWENDYSGPPLISLTSDLASGFGVDLGDTLTVNVLGRNLTGTISSIREVNWQTLAMQFAIIFSPGTLDSAPQTWLGAAYGVDEEDGLYARATAAFPGGGRGHHPRGARQRGRDH
jgi:putative ABC transport system permease protein